MRQKTLELIIENQPEHFWKTWNSNIPIEVALTWLKKYVKKDITRDDFNKFMMEKNLCRDIEEYKKTTHFLILRDVLEIDLEEFEWFHRAITLNKNNISFNRHFKLWQLSRT